MSTARYGDAIHYPAECALYGATGLVYGPASRPDTVRLTWSVEVDWDDDGGFDGVNEVMGLYDLETDSGRTQFLRSSEDGFVPVGPSSATLLYHNLDGRLDPFNGSGPLFGQLLPGKLVRIRVLLEDSGVVQPVLLGRLRDIRPASGEYDRVKLEVVGVQDEMRGSIRTSVQQAIRYDDAIELLLSTAAWPYGAVIDTTVSEVMPYWWARGNELFTELMSLVDSALGLLCIDEQGRVVYRSRVSTDSPLASISGLDVERVYGVLAPAPQEVVRNQIDVFARTRSLHAAEELWRMTDVVKILAGASLTVWASFSFNGQDGVALSVVTPVATTHYTANAAANGGGADLTGSIRVELTSFATAAKLVITNAGGVDAYITLLRLVGDILVPDAYTFVEAVDQDSIDLLGARPFAVQSDWLQDVNTARDEAALLKLRLSSVRMFPRVMLLPNPALQFALRLQGLASVNIASRGISGEFRVGRVHHKWLDEVGQAVRTEVYFEPNLLGATSGTWIFPAIFDISTVF